MANIDLNLVLKKISEPASLVDSDIKIAQNSKKDIYYSDLKLDLECEQYNAEQLNSGKTGTDLSLLTDELSILNSVKNTLTTKYHSRLLNPEINFDLRKYLFEGLSAAKAYFIGYDISTYLPSKEPRIRVEKIHVTAYFNDITYGIELSLLLPSLNKNIKLNGILNLDGIYFN
jgi:phage baseplate assembly protein W